MPTTTPDDADQREVPYWNLGADDKRLILITALGGLAANIGLVLVLGLGLLIDHRMGPLRQESHSRA